MVSHAHDEMVPVSRLDTLTDGVFAIAMTLLVLDLKLPEHFRAASTTDFFDFLSGLVPTLLVYVSSFLVLALRWVSLVRLSRPVTRLPDHYVSLSLVHLCLICCMPFTAALVVRHVGFAPAIWLYAGLMFVTSLIALQMARLMRDHITPLNYRGRRFGLAALMIVSVLAIGVSVVAPVAALWLYLLNALVPAAWAFWCKGEVEAAP